MPFKNDPLSPPRPPLLHWWNPPSHDGLLDADIVESVANASDIDKLLWDTHSFYTAMANYVRTCLACRASARRMGLPYGSKQDWWDFVYEADTFLCSIESRLMFILEEMIRRQYKPKKKNKNKNYDKPSSRPLKKRRVFE